VKGRGGVLSWTYTVWQQSEGKGQEGAVSPWIKAYSSMFSSAAFETRECYLLQVEVKQRCRRGVRG